MVINGDIFDFLAVRPDAPEFNLNASWALREMATDAELQPIFKALAAFLRPASDKSRTLVLQIGNHDIELALPAVQETLRELLGVTDAATHRPTTRAGCAAWARGACTFCTAISPTPGIVSITPA